ncbi:MAG: hypothetical protein FWB71_02380 [Defluviitaleaceae bacterium]|nr:hypothetical protein [Defluviitaleaceae bacterium]
MTPAREKALNDIVSSIAAEETALSLLITAESKKVEYALAYARYKGCTEKELCMILEINNSVNSMMGRVADIQIILKNKLALVTSLFPPPPCPPPPPPPTYTCEDFQNIPFPMDTFYPPHKKEFTESE